MARILVADDEEEFRHYLSRILTRSGHDVVVAEDGQEAFEHLARRQFDLILSDMQMPRLGGLDLLRHVRANWPEVEFVVITAFASIEIAVEAMRLGAYDFMQKPLPQESAILRVVERALEHGQLVVARDRARYTEPPVPPLTYGAPAMQNVVDMLKKVAPTNATVLLLGESGCGKEMAARALHRWSPRANGPFMAVNCAAIAEGLLESELLGHEKGAFTGAHAPRPGRLELAHGGTFFLDEIGDMRPELQVKLLRILQERTFERVGSSRTLEVDVRWIAATNSDLTMLVKDGAFREDLYHRLAVFPVRLPPLRERREDIPPLARTLLAGIVADLGRGPLDLTPDAEQRLMDSPWTGNVRELRNVLERASILASGSTIGPEDLVLESLGSAGSPADASHSRKARLDDLEKDTIVAVLAETGGNRKKAAERLGIALRTLHNKLNRYGLR